MCNVGYAQLFELRLKQIGQNSKEKDLSVMKAIESDAEYFVGSTKYSANREVMHLKRITDAGTILWSNEYTGRYVDTRFFSFVEIQREDNFELIVSGYSVDTIGANPVRQLTVWWIDASNGVINKSHIFPNFPRENVYGLNIKISPYDQSIYIAGLISPDYVLDTSSPKESFAMKMNYDGDLSWVQTFDSGVHPDSSTCGSDYDALNHIVFGNNDEVYLIGNANYPEMDTNSRYCNKLKAQLLKLSVYDGVIIAENKHSLGGNINWNAGVRGIRREEGIVVLENNSLDSNFSLLEFDNAGNIAGSYNYDILNGVKIENTYGYNIKEDERYYFVTGLMDNSIDTILKDTASLFIYKIDKSNFAAVNVTVFPLKASWYIESNTGDYLKDYLKLFPIAYYPENSDLFSREIYGVSGGSDSGRYERVIVKDNINLDKICTNIHLHVGSYVVSYDVYDQVTPSPINPDRDAGPDKESQIQYDNKICLNEDAGRRKLSRPSEKNEDELNIYPNPSTGDLFVQGQGISKIEIMDSRGQLVAQVDKLTQENAHHVKTDQLANGVYIVKVYQRDSISQEKIVVMNGK